mmetsp:Transcript_126701/g.270272  ORF Transcript_126701/g.270272 Transcript_126701/m.270272 type:complete len:220 (-) Transcript_126701:83-742(-)
MRKPRVWPWLGIFLASIAPARAAPAAPGRQELPTAGAAASAALGSIAFPAAAPRHTSDGPRLRRPKTAGGRRSRQEAALREHGLALAREPPRAAPNAAGLGGAASLSIAGVAASLPAGGGSGSGEGAAKDDGDGEVGGRAGRGGGGERRGEGEVPEEGEEEDAAGEVLRLGKQPHFFGLPKIFWALVADALAMLGFVACIPFILTVAKRRRTAAPAPAS